MPERIAKTLSAHCYKMVMQNRNDQNPWTGVEVIDLVYVLVGAEPTRWSVQEPQYKDANADEVVYRDKSINTDKINKKAIYAVI